MAAEILEPKKVVCHCLHFISICPEVMGLDAMILGFCTIVANSIEITEEV